MHSFEGRQERSPITRAVEVERGTSDVLRCDVEYKTATLFIRKTPDGAINVTGIQGGYGVPMYDDLPPDLKRAVEKAFSDFEETVA